MADETRDPDDPRDEDGYLTFRAMLPNIQSAWTVSGESQPTARIKLDIPASDFRKVLPLMALGGLFLEVRVKVLDKD